MLLDELIPKILQNPKPVLFCDTCSYLDILRFPTRVKDLNLIGSVFDKIRDIKERVESDNCYLVSPDIVKIELEKHIESIINDLLILNNQIGMCIELCHRLSPAEIFTIRDLQLHIKLKDFYTSFLNNMMCLICDKNLKNAGYLRAGQNLYPAKNKRGNANDSIIFEMLLKLSSNLRNNTFSDRIVFITSNINDFGKVGDIENEKEYEEFNIEYTTTWNHAHSALTK